MVQGLGAPAGSTTLAGLLLRPGLPDVPSGSAVPEARGQKPLDRVAFSAEAQQRADLAKHTVATLEADGAWWSAAAFGWLLHQRLLTLLNAGVDRAFGAGRSAPAGPTRGGAVDSTA